MQTIKSWVKSMLKLGTEYIRNMHRAKIMVKWELDTTVFRWFITDSLNCKVERRKKVNGYCCKIHFAFTLFITFWRKTLYILSWYYSTYHSISPAPVSICPKMLLLRVYHSVQLNVRFTNNNSAGLKLQVQRMCWSFN